MTNSVCVCGNHTQGVGPKTWSVPHMSRGPSPGFSIWSTSHMSYVRRQQKTALHKAKKYPSNIHVQQYAQPQIYSLYLLHILFILIYTHIWLCLQNQDGHMGWKKQQSHPVEGVAMDDLRFPSTFIAALARSHAAKQRFTSSIVIVNSC